ncbi:hypothetical protein [Actinomadura sp. NPDC048394]|uniref:hypothetical protein n=1 Tax=Actinomadura sp. NPDC048394 TaxID=3158223 RepID=UPI0033D92188
MTPFEGSAREIDQEAQVVAFTVNVTFDAERDRNAAADMPAARSGRVAAKIAATVVGVATVLSSAVGLAQWLHWPS